MKQSIADKLAALRQKMSEHSIQVLLIPRTDEYLNEYVAAYAERLHFISNFSGSAGLGIITQSGAVLFTDARYTEQASKQCDPAYFEIIDSADTKPLDWLKANAAQMSIGYDPSLHTVHQIHAMAEWGVVLKALNQNLVDGLWTQQPPTPRQETSDFPEHIAGASTAQKISAICESEKEASLDALILTTSDSISWLMNIRGNAVPYTPYALGAVHLSIADEAAASLLPPYSFEGLSGQRVGLDFKNAPMAIYNALERTGAQVVDIKDPCILPRAIKTSAEQDAIRKAHLHDGIALTKFLHHMDTSRPSMAELDVVDCLETFRKQSPYYKGPSFPTIAGYNPNGAIIHYRATPETNRAIEGDGFLLIDSGGQYAGDDVWGTTDITRTLPVGEPPAEMKEHYTLVLKGHIALSSARFKEGTLGKELDELARGPLKAKGLNYAHGTGHGVGCYLSVHEDAAGISPRGEDPVRPGMLLSNEPGYYQSGDYGIRIENLVFVMREEGADDMLLMQDVTLAPIELSCIIHDMLNPQEKQWLNEYHARVYKTLGPHLEVNVQNWLEEKTQPV